MTLREKLKSRKLWVTILTVAVGVWNPALLPLLKIALPTYVVSQGAVDAVAAWNKAREKS